MRNRMRSIGAKVTALALVAALAPTVLFGIIVFVGMHSIRDMARDSNGGLGRTAAGRSAEALTTQAREHLLDLVKGSADLDDERLSEIQCQVRILANLAENTYRAPERYPPRAVSPPLAENVDRLAAQLVFEGGHEETAETREEIGRLAHLQDVFVQFSTQTPSIGGIYISTASGFTIIADTLSGSRLGHDYRHPIQERLWYRMVLEQEDIAWTDTMEDGSGRGLGIVCAAPVRDASGDIVAVVGIGSLLGDLQRGIETRIGEKGYMFLVNGQGRILLSGSREGIFAADGQGESSADLRLSPDRRVAETVTRMLAGGQGVKELTINGEQAYLAYAPIGTLGWSLGAVMEREEVVAPAVELERAISGTSVQVIDQIDARMLRVLAVVLLLLLAVSVAAAVYGVTFSRRLTAPLASLMKGVREIGGGQIGRRIEVKTGDELEQLADAFNGMTGELDRYMENLTRVTADKERISTELGVATRIQTGMLPCIFPAFPERPELDIHATMNPAKEVGGDFYDFFMIGDKCIGLVVADVSGKGVPAALFMVIAKTLIKNYAQSGLEPGEVFRRVNNKLCENNEESMFVTAFLGILDMEDGRFSYANAGHNPPLIARYDTKYQWLKERSGLILAGVEDAPYQQFSTTLHRGDRLFLYTDGVTEAQDPRGELFGEQRLIDLFQSGQLEKESSRMSLEAVAEKLAEFAGGAEQTDDITMLYMKLN